jgi:hypothetical protein
VVKVRRKLLTGTSGSENGGMSSEIKVRIFDVECSRFPTRYLLALGKATLRRGREA